MLNTSICTYTFTHHILQRVLSMHIHRLCYSYVCTCMHLRQPRQAHVSLSAIRVCCARACARARCVQPSLRPSQRQANLGTLLSWNHASSLNVSVFIHDHEGKVSECVFIFLDMPVSVAYIVFKETCIKTLRYRWVYN